MSMRSVIFWVGLDVHKDSITAAVFRGRDPEPLRVDRIPNDPKRIRRYSERLQRGGEVRACYEASGAGYVLQRMLLEWGVPCELAAPSLIPRRPGEHRKTDRRDAIKIARDFRDDRLVLIHIPTEEDDWVRDIVRCRETFQREIIKSRHYILKFLRRRGFIYRGGTHWTTQHMNWIRHFLMPGKLPEEDRIVLGESLALLEYKLQRRDDLDGHIEALALTPRYKPVVDRIGCFRGVKAQAAMVLATELGDLRRFESPRQLMAYLGLVPSEHSSGTEGDSGPSPKPATPAFATYSCRRPGTTEGDLPSASPYGNVSRARILRSSPTPGSVSTGSTSSIIVSQRRNPSRWRRPRWPARWSDSSRLCSVTSTPPHSRPRR
jgi:transposase